jgi:3-phenylpropionate/trans-cinnamate dioxygenase ferredoxin reductase component
MTGSCPTNRLLLATGAACRRLELPGCELDGIYFLRELADAARIRTQLRPGIRLVLVGGGVIGLEIAASAIQKGCDVTVVEATNNLMGRVLPAELAEVIADHHKPQGVTIMTGTKPVAFVGSNGRVGEVAFADGSGAVADAVVIGIGTVPRPNLARPSSSGREPSGYRARQRTHAWSARKPQTGLNS